jgi:hypothetical protein
MIQCRSRTSFSAETFESLGIVRQIVREKFQSDKASKLSIFSLVNDAHASAAELVQNAVMGNGLSED